MMPIAHILRNWKEKVSIARIYHFIAAMPDYTKRPPGMPQIMMIAIGKQ